MIIRFTLPSGHYVSATTRRANYTDCYYAKYTVWPSKRHYDAGDCLGAITFKNLFLGNGLDRAQDYIKDSAIALVKTYNETS